MTKQNSFTKKVFSLLLSLAMVLTMMPAAAFAADDIAVQASEYVAEVTIGDETTQYADINEAFKVVKDANDATIKLLRDTEIDNQYHDGGGVELKGSGRTTLDLNGKTLKQAQASSYASCGTVSTRETATLIIKDSAGGGRIQQINENPAVITNGNSTLIIESGTIETMNSDDKESYVCYLNCAVNLDDNSTVIINGGTLKGKRGVVEEVSSNGSLTITGGDISGTDGNALIVYGDSPATLSGGTFSTESNDHSIWVNQDGRTAKDLLAENYHYETSTGAESTYSDDGKGVKGNTIVKIPADKQVSYINADGVEAAQTNFMELSGGDHAIAITQGGWFAVRTDTTIKGLSISDEVNLILCDGATLTVSDTLTVAEGCKLNIYFQTNGTGKLTAATVSSTDQITAPAGAMKKTTDTNGTTFEKCLTHEWGETTSGSVFIKTCTLCGTVNKENAVAKLTTSGSVETYYTTLSEAFSAAAESENSTVQLLMDVQSTENIEVKSGTFTIDLNGKKWEGTTQGVTAVLGVEGGNVTVTSTNGTGTISNAVNSAIYVANNATVHVMSGVRLNRLYAMDAANLTLDVGVIITDSFSTKAENLALFLTGKALQKCDADGKKTDGQYVSIYKGYNVTDTGCVIVIEHKSCDGTPSKETPCEICGYDGTQTKPTEPVDPNVAMIGDKKYESLQTAIGEANGADITLLRVFGENVVVEDGAKAGIILGTGDTVEGKGTYPSYWTAAQDDNPPYIPLTMNAGEITLKDGVLAQFIAGANNNIAISLKGGTLTVADTVTKIIGGSVDITSENTAQMAAIEATGGVLDLQGNTHLDGGLIMRDGAKLKNKLTAGTFTNSGSTTASVSVEGNNYTTVFDLLEKGYAFAKYNADGTTGDVITKDDKTKELKENVAVIVCTHKDANDASLYENGTCKGCGYVCDHQSVVIETGKCKTCDMQMAAKVDDSYFITLAAAIEAAKSDGAVTLLADVEENITIADGMNVTVDLNGKKWEGYGTGWQAAVPLTVKGGNVTVKNGTLNQGGASSYANHAVIVNGGSLIVGEGMTIQGGKRNSGTVCPAITVESGNLSLSVGTKLYGGMSVPAGKTLADYLPTGTAFVHIPDGGAGSFVNGYVQELTGNFTLHIEKHTHYFVGSNSKCACGFTCAHSSFSNGKCDICGYECTHPSDKVNESSDTATCGICGAQMVVKVENGDTTTYYAKHFEDNAYHAEDTLKQVFNNAAHGSTITLLADGLYASAGVTGKNITLELNGKNLIENNGFVVESKDSTFGKLTVTGNGTSTTPENSGYPCTFRVWDGGELVFGENFSGSYGTIYVHGGALTSVNESQSAIHIGTLDITNSGATVSLKGGTFGTITCSGSKTLGDLLAKGYAFKKADGSYVTCDTMINSQAVENVTVVKCIHEKIENVKVCPYCESVLAATVTKDGNTTGYTSAQEAVNHADSGTVKLLADVSESLGISSALKLDCNGHTIEKLTVSSDVTLESLLPEGYAFKSNDKWVSDINGTTLEKVTTAEAPVKSVTANNPTIKVKYGESYTLFTTFEWTGDTKASNPQIKWEYKNGGYLYEQAPTLTGYETNSRTMDFLISKENERYPAQVGTYTYVVTFTKDGYSKSCEFTVTIEKADAKVTTAPKAKENLTYNSNEQSLITTGITSDGTLMYSLTKDGTYKENIPTGKNAGKYIVWYKVMGDKNHKDSEPQSVEVTIKAKELSISDFTIAAKTYDETTNAEVARVTFSGLENGDNLEIGTDFTAVAEFDNANAGENKTVTLTITPKENSTALKNYQLTKATFEKSGFAIAKATPEASAKAIATSYSGSAVSADKITGTATFNGKTIEGIWSWKDGQALTNVADSGEKKVVFTPDDTTNFKPVETTLELTINKATPAGNPACDEVTASGRKLSEVKLSSKDADGKDLFTVSGTVAWENGDTEVKQGEKYKWQFTPTDTDNYTPFTGEIIPWEKPASSGGGAVIPASEVTTDKTGTADEKATTSPAEVKTETKTGADGSTETISKVTVSDANQKEIIKQVKDNKSEEIIIKVSEKDVKDGTKLELDLDKDFVDSIIKDTDAKLTIKTPAGDKTFTQEELKKLSESAEGGVITIDSSVFEEPTEPAEPSGMLTPAQEKIVKGVKATTITLKSVRTKSGKLRLTWSKSKGYKVDYFEVYRSVKKNSGYGKKPFFTTKSGDVSKYLNTKNLKAGKTYYYKVRGVRVINGKKYYTEYSNKTWKKAK